MRLQSPPRRQRESILMLGTLTMVAMFGMLGLGIDAAYLFHLKRMAQVAVDAGAKAASIELKAGSTADAVAAAARADITTNGFTDGVKRGRRRSK